MPEIVDIQISDLLLDAENPRYADIARNQQAAATVLAEKHPTHILKLAADIVEKGLDPTTLPAGVATDDNAKSDTGYSRGTGGSWQLRPWRPQRLSRESSHRERPRR